VDRSLIYPDHIPGLFEVRNRLVNQISEQLGSDLGTVIAYSETARVTSVEDASSDGPDFVYGSNLQHALVVSRAANDRAAGSGGTILVTYSVPSAHHVSGAPFFMEPPLPESLEAAQSEFQTCSAEGIRIDVLMIAPRADGGRSMALQTYFRPMAEAAGGIAVLVLPDSPLEPVVQRVLQTNRTWR
jgi:uncharacterized protein with von Willebrand factor type A (vWA) domain